MRYFLDNCLSPSWARGLQELFGDSPKSVIHLREKFVPDTADVVWLEKLGAEKDWIVISGDIRITKSPHERQAWKLSGLTCFFLSPAWGNHPFHERTWRIVRWWPPIVKQAKLLPAGTGFVVPINFKGEGQFDLVK